MVDHRTSFLGSMLCLLRAGRPGNRIWARYQVGLERWLRGHMGQGVGSLARREKQEERFPAQFLAEGFRDL